MDSFQLVPWYKMLLALVRNDINAPPCPRPTEPNLLNRLRAAFVLRGYPVNVCYGITVTYKLLPELALIRVVSQTSTRNWGQPKDLQELALAIVINYPLGIIFFHHRLGQVFHFTCDDESPRLIKGYRALRYAGKFQDCLVLAREDTEDGTTYAQVHVATVPPHKCVGSADGLREFLLNRICRVPGHMFTSRPQRSQASSDESLEDAEHGMP